MATTDPPIETTIGRYVKKPDDLKLLAEDIEECRARVEKAAGEALRYAIEAGELLREAKDKVPYGQWDSWMRDNLKGHVTTYRIYMRLARYREQIEAAGAEGIREAMNLIAGQPNAHAMTDKADQAKAIKAAHPHTPIRKIAETLNVSEGAVQGWLNPESLEIRNANTRERNHRAYKAIRKTISCECCGATLYLDGSRADA